jgi:hypothetical protein
MSTNSNGVIVGNSACDINNNTNSQKFFFKNLGNQQFQIMNYNRDKCLSGATEPWSFTTCNDTDNNQKFKWVYYNSSYRKPLLKNEGSSKCLNTDYQLTSNKLVSQCDFVSGLDVVINTIGSW